MIVVNKISVLVFRHIVSIIKIALIITLQLTTELVIDNPLEVLNDHQSFI